jgi:trans-2,3-dihydro-3-hydroxyanthranilate isomerase
MFPQIEVPMPKFHFIQVDAFTDRPLSGNPCAVLFDTDDLDSETMLAIAKEMNLSETAFIRASKIADFGARYFTPAEEIPLAGHPTIATVFALIESGRLSIQGTPQEITLELMDGPIKVEIIPENDSGVLILMSQRKPQFLNTYDPEEIMPAFGLSIDDVLPSAPIQTVSTGTPQLMIPIASLESLKRVLVDAPAFTKLRASGDFFSPHLFVLQGITDSGDTFARHFGVPPDTPEDPFTGSATGGMAAYLWRYGLLARPTFVAEQGHWMGRPGVASVEIIGPPEKIESVKVGGRAVAVLAGEFFI